MNNQHIKPALATILLALIFPVYWSSVFYLGSFEDDIFAFIKADMLSVSFSDIMFLMIGVLEIYIYLSLAKLLKHQLDSSSASILLVVMAAASGLFHGTVLFDVVLSFTSGVQTSETVDNFVSVGIFVSIASLVVLSVSTFVCSLVMLFKQQQLPSVLKVFSVLLLLVSVFQFTVVFASFNILLFPVTLILLAVYFFKEPESLEIL